MKTVGRVGPFFDAHLHILDPRFPLVENAGFGRLDLPIRQALRAIAAVNPGALVFGTDLPGTRARRPFRSSDLALLIEALADPVLIRNALRENAIRLYRPASRRLSSE